MDIHSRALVYFEHPPMVFILIEGVFGTSSDETRRNALPPSARQRNSKPPPSFLSSLTNNNWRRLFDKFEEGVVNHSIGTGGGGRHTRWQYTWELQHSLRLLGLKGGSSMGYTTWILFKVRIPGSPRFKSYFCVSRPTKIQFRYGTVQTKQELHQYSDHSKGTQHQMQSQSPNNRASMLVRAHRISHRISLALPHSFPSLTRQPFHLFGPSL